MLLVYTFLTFAGIGLIIILFRRNSKLRRLDQLRKDYRIALNGNDLEEAIAIGRAYCYLQKGYTGPDDERKIRDDWEAIQKNKPSASRTYSAEIYTSLTGERL
ncbi:hypothetical protein [Arsenicibacter rosenii]|uniref:Uncharacterized protein n=1 Tax=Arsenicibacter rosenii TaxID=1750698 RepID=A0A1S2VFW1_9BACT|nr:hypothetical protein [Arsenicibacter rosenii]OIN57310.1 hypothetical protein BLX24_20235 [Arsenicibacter rosenii]